MRTPLTSLLTWSQLLARMERNGNLLQETLRSALSRIEEDARRLSEICDRSCIPPQHAASIPPVNE